MAVAEAKEAKRAVEQAIPLAQAEEALPAQAEEAPPVQAAVARPAPAAVARVAGVRPVEQAARA